MSKNSKKISVVFGAVVFACMACSGLAPVVNEARPTPVPNETVNVKQVADVKKLIKQGPQAFDKLYGKAVEAFETDDPGTVPGEMRDYKIAGVSNPQTTTAGMTVRFYKGKAVEIMIDLPSPTSSSTTALNQVGLDTPNTAPERTPVTEFWSNKTFNGVRFTRVWVYKLDTDSPLFTTVKVAAE